MYWSQGNWTIWPDKTGLKTAGKNSETLLIQYITMIYYNVSDWRLAFLLSGSDSHNLNFGPRMLCLLPLILVAILLEFPLTIIWKNEEAT